MKGISLHKGHLRILPHRCTSPKSAPCSSIDFDEAEPFRNNQQGWSLLINPPHQLVWQRELSQECWTFHFY